MKRNKLLLVALTLALVGCKETNTIDNNSSNNSSVDSSTSIKESTSSSIEDSSSDSSSIVDSSSSDSSSQVVDDPNAKYYELPNWQEWEFDIGLGADFLDIAVGRAFMTGCDYSLSYSYGSKVSSDMSKDRVISSNEEVFTVEKVSNGALKVTAKHAGKAMLRLYDSNDIIRYCGVITVEDPIPLEDMEEYLVYDAEYWVSVIGWGDSYSITFLEGGRYILSGMFSNEAFETVNGTYEYVGISVTGKEYVYTFTDDDVSVVGFSGFDISMTGTFMYLQEDGGTASILFPNDKVEED